ncbi:Protein of unknown function [Mesorhizobium albiziae]|uniref:DUF982 domain-containing protein n=1 Tax=Neomesorhizobium albiziae TaxID=335020 RepID=A0A1I4CZF2_9HYPH|nr:DUF982 domain-containing protein [Mesorhizobium albiziae]GLS28419.1 hypothetical protein GCM10007937_01260 [Mesorhizobium albiziae]SFK86143.1 Protein of unknown function [Mesorhizobium albiziae]
MIVFEPPVGIYLGIGQIRVVNSLQDAAECLMSEKWPGLRGAAFEKATLILIAASAGFKNADQARQAFASAAVEAGILVDPKLLVH